MRRRRTRGAHQPDPAGADHPPPGRTAARRLRPTTHDRPAHRRRSRRTRHHRRKGHHPPRRPRAHRPAATLAIKRPAAHRSCSAPAPSSTAQAAWRSTRWHRAGAGQSTTAWYGTRGGRPDLDKAWTPKPTMARLEGPVALPSWVLSDPARTELAYLHTATTRAEPTLSRAKSAMGVAPLEGE